MPTKFWKWLLLGATGLLLCNSGYQVYKVDECVKNNGTIMMSYTNGVTCLE